MAYRIFFKEELDEESEKKLETEVDKVTGILETKMESISGKYYLGDKITVADFILFTIYTIFCYPEKTMRPKHTEASSKCLSKYPKVSAWIETMKGELASYLETT